MRRLLLSVLALSLGGAARADEGAEKLVRQMLQTVEDLGALLKKVDDQSAAEQALPKVKELTKRYAALKEQAAKLKVNEAGEGRLLKKYEPKLYDAGVTVGREVDRLRRVDPARAVVAEVEKFTRLLNGPKEGEAKPALPKGSAGDADKLLAAMLSAFDELGAVLESVHDDKTAAAALPKVKAIHQRLKAVKARDVDVTEEVKRGLVRKYEAKLQSAGARVGSEYARLKVHDFAAELTDEVARILDFANRMGSEQPAKK